MKIFYFQNIYVFPVFYSKSALFKLFKLNCTVHRSSSFKVQVCLHHKEIIQLKNIEEQS